MQYRPETGDTSPQQNPAGFQQNPAGFQQTPAGFQQAEPRRVSTNTSDKHYDLVSVLYHALEGAQTYAQYAEDAGREGDQELAQFFVQVQQSQISCAEKAKQLLGRRLSQMAAH